LAAVPLRAAWEQGGVPGAEILRLTFDGGAPKVSVAAMSGGLDIWLPGLTLTESPAAGVQVSREAGGSRLKIARPGVELSAVDVDDKEIRIRIAKPAEPDSGSDSNYKIGVGDTVTVTVYKNPDLSGEFPVAHDGTINLPLAGPIPARGFTDTELA